MELAALYRNCINTYLVLSDRFVTSVLLHFQTSTCSLIPYLCNKAPVHLRRNTTCTTLETPLREQGASFEPLTLSSGHLHAL